MIETNSKKRQGPSLWSQLYIAISYIVLLSKDPLGDGCGTETFKAVAINNKTCILHVCVMLFHTLIHMGLKLKNISKKNRYSVPYKLWRYHKFQNGSWGIPALNLDFPPFSTHNSKLRLHLFWLQWRSRMHPQNF